MNGGIQFSGQPVSVVVPFYNAKGTLHLCLSALNHQAYTPYEVILVDNNSCDGSSDIAKSFVQRSPEKFTYTREPHQGPAYARNRGASQSKGEYILFTDADCIPSPDWIHGIVSSFESEDIGAVAGRTLGYEKRTTLDKFHSLFTFKGLSKSKTYAEFLLISGGFPTANLAIRMPVFKEVGGFDETMKIYSEDYDLCARIYQKQYKITYSFDAVVYHKHRNTLAGTWRQSFGFGTGHAVLLRKHLPRHFILDLPRFQYVFKNAKFSGWVDLAGADKKMMFLAILSFFWIPGSLLLIIYICLLFKNVESRAKNEDLVVSFMEKVQLIILLVIKSAALTAGRIVGAFRHRIICF